MSPRQIGEISLSRRLASFVCVCALGFSLQACAFRPNGSLVQVDASGLLGNGEAQYRYAMHAYRKGETEKARRALERVLRHNPRHAQAHNNLGLIHYESRRLVEAADHFDFASQLLPNSATPLNNLGMTLEAGGRVDEAIEFYAQAHGMDPRHPLYLGNLLRARVRMGEQSMELIDDLKFLAFIETRPEWVAWVDEMLGLHQNLSLDRGPEVEENPLAARSQSSARGDQRSVPPESALEQMGAMPFDDRGPTLAPEVLELEDSAGTQGGFWQELENQLPVPTPAR